MAHGLVTYTGMAHWPILSMGMWPGLSSYMAHGLQEWVSLTLFPTCQGIWGAHDLAALQLHCTWPHGLHTQSPGRRLKWTAARNKWSTQMSASCLQVSNDCALKWNRSSGHRLLYWFCRRHELCNRSLPFSQMTQDLNKPLSFYFSICLMSWAFVATGS